MSDINLPCYFHEFMARAEAQGLQFLTEVGLAHSLLSNLPPEVAQRITESSGSLIEVEQYIDHVLNRTFRQTLLVHAERHIQRQLNPTAILDLYVCSEAQAIDPPEGAPPGAVQFVARDDQSFVTADPLVKTAFNTLIQTYPRAFRVRELAARATQAVFGDAPPPAPPDAIAMHIAQHVLAAYTRSLSMMELRTVYPAFTLEVSERPRVSPLVAAMAAHGSLVITRLHRNADLESFARALVLLLDGTRDRDALLVEMKKVAKPRESASGVDPDTLLAAAIEDQLRWFAGVGLLVG
jgi:hypothetical protein